MRNRIINRAKLLTISTFITSIFMSTIATASFTFVGEIETKAPATTITSLTAEPVAFVKELVAKIETAASPCEFTFDETVAQNNSSTIPYCFIEWITSDEYASSGSRVSGVPLNYGDITLGYQISVFSGSVKTKVHIHSDTIIIKVLEPIEPMFKSASTYIGNKWNDGVVTENHNLASKLNAVKIELETRNYDQKVKIEPYGYCTVAENANFCTIMVGSTVLGSREQEVGEKTTFFNINSNNGYFAQGKGSIRHTWDYSPPFIEDADAYVVSEENSETSKTVMLSGISIEIKNEIAKVVISSPHSDRSDDWWIPDFLHLEFTPDETIQATEPLKVDGHVLYQAADSTLLSKVNVKSNAIPQRHGDQWIYEINMLTVPDGVYKVNIIASDKNQNKVTKEFDKLSFIRQRPEVKLFKNYVHLKDGAEFYFTENLLAASFNKYRDSTKVDSIEIDGLALPITEGEGNVKRITINAEQLNLENNSLHRIKVTASDKAGNVSVKSYDALYRPLVFKLETSGGDNTIYQSVQNVSSKVTEIKNNICSFAPNIEIAKRNATSYRYSCLFRWSAVPEGMEEDYRTTAHIIKGTIKESGPQEITYNVYLYDHNGNETLILTDTKFLETETPPDPVFEFLDDNKTAAGAYPVSIDGGLMNTFKVVSVPADITIETGIGETYKRYERRQNPRQKMMRSYIKSYVPKGNLWDVVDVPIIAAYDKLPSSNATDTLKAFYIPKRGISAKLTFDKKYGLNTNTEQVSVELGKYDRRNRVFLYDKSVMGEWDIQLVKMINRKEYEVISTKKSIGDVQKVTFDVDTKLLSEGGGKLFAIASIVSPIEGYELKIETNKLFMRVYKGGLLEGGYKYKKLIGNIPFTVSMSYKAKTREDSIAMGDVRWEKSTDNVTWTRINEYDNKLYIRRKIEDVSNTYMRVVVTNKFTGLETKAESLNIIAFDKPSIKIKRQNAAFVGETAKFELFSNGEKAQTSEMEIEWSTDNGETWIQGNNNLSLEEHESENSRYLMARTRLLGEAQLAGEKGWSSRALISYSWLKPRRLSVRSEMPRKMEIGKTFTAKAFAKSLYVGTESRVRNEWLLGGEVIATNTTEVEVVADKQYVNRGNYEIQFRAWLDGQKEGTFKETTFKVRVWEYQFPEVSLAIPTTSAYAPNTFKVLARNRLPSTDDITFTSRFYVINGGEDTATTPASATDSVAYFRFEYPGVKVIGYKLSDSRGNEKEVTSIVELFPSMPMEVNLEGSFSNVAMRYPLDGTIRAQIVIAHPDDKMEKWEWSIINNNTGEETVLQGRSRSYLSDLGIQEGTASYTVKLKATTIFGQVGEQALDIFVNRNIKPTCTMDISESSTSIRAELDCDDVDGKIAKYAWYINGVKLANYQYAITLTKSRLEGGTVTIKGEGIDNSFESDSVTITKSYNTN